MSLRAPIGLLLAALAASAALLFSLDSQLTFVGDPWELLAGRPDWSASTFLEPFNEHPIVLPALIYKTLLTLFGMNSALPFYTVSISLFLLCATLLFVFLRQRVGDWAALGGAVLILFLGAAYEDLLWEFQMGFFGSIAAGLGALLALDRKDRLGDRVASVLLLIATAFSTLGIPFIAAALADVSLGSRPRWRRIYVPLLPLALYLIWWLLSGRSAGGQIGLADIPALPRYIFDVAAAGIASLLGRQPIASSGQPPLLAQMLTVLLAAALLYWIGRRREIPSGLLVALVLIFAFWMLLALDRGPQRFSSRFQYPSAVFLLIVAAEALRGQRLPRPVIVALAVIVAGAVASGVGLLQQGYADRWKPTANQVRATLAAIEMAGPAARPEYMISLPPSIFLSVGEYRHARRMHGTPAFSEAHLLSTGEATRHLADQTLVGALDLRLRAPLSGSILHRCRTLDSADGMKVEARLSSPGGFQLETQAHGRVILGLRRFSATSWAQFGYLTPEATKSFRLPADRSPRPWWLHVTGGPVRLCASG